MIVSITTTDIPHCLNSVHKTIIFLNLMRHFLNRVKHVSLRSIRISIIITQSRFCWCFNNCMIFLIKRKTWENRLFNSSWVLKLFERFLSFVFKFFNSLLLYSFQDAVSLPISYINTIENKTFWWNLRLFIILRP